MYMSLGKGGGFRGLLFRGLLRCVFLRWLLLFTTCAEGANDKGALSQTGSRDDGGDDDDGGDGNDDNGVGP
jgi:hypothetical protein